MERRDYSAPADAPYTAEDVVVHTSAGLKLSGTLTIPRGRATGRAPAVVTITGLGTGGPRRRVDGAQGISAVSRAGRHAGSSRHRGASAGRSRRERIGSRTGERDVAQFRGRHSCGRGVSSHASGDRRRAHRARRSQRGWDHRADDRGDGSTAEGDRADGGNGVARPRDSSRAGAVRDRQHVASHGRGARARGGVVTARARLGGRRHAVDEVLLRV